MLKLFTDKEVIKEMNIPKKTLERLVEKGLNYQTDSNGKSVYNIDVVKKFLSQQREGIEKLSLGAVLDNRQLSSAFGCAPQGGMRRSYVTNTLVLITHQEDKSNPYQDNWTGGILNYTGMGLTGNQDINNGQNKTLAESNDVNVDIYLFEVYKKGEYTFKGQVELVKQPFEDNEEDQNGVMRKVWKFPIALVGSKQDVIDIEQLEVEQEANKQLAKQLADNELENKAIMNSRSARSVSVRSKGYIRDQYVSEYTKRRAKGVCQLCNAAAPFSDKDGQPYLESHHVIWLSNGGEDSIKNTAALCPNCHTRIHILNGSEDQRKLLEIISAYE